MVDECFANPRLAAVYDDLDPDRSDLEHYVAIVEELGARSVLDIGCGTGTFAGLLAARGIDVVGVDPAEASLEVGRSKPFADDVRWLCGDATELPPLQVDLATMTANVGQVFVEDDDWSATLKGIHAALHPDGHLVFEVRDPARRAWESWTPKSSFTFADIPGIGRVETWVEVTDVSLPLVSFRRSFRFEPEGDVLISESTLRFRDHAEIEASLCACGFSLQEVRNAPDRPGKELVFLARTVRTR